MKKTAVFILALSLFAHSFAVEYGGTLGESVELYTNDFDPVALRLSVRRLDSREAAYVETDGSVEFQGTTARGGFRVAEHDAYFLANLVGENNACVSFCDKCGEFAEGLRHQSGLEADVVVSHFAFDFSLWDEGCD